MIVMCILIIVSVAGLIEFFYQNQIPPSSSLSSYETNYSNWSRLYQHNSDLSLRQNHSKPCTPPRHFRDLNYTILLNLLMIRRLRRIVIVIKVIMDTIETAVIPIHIENLEKVLLWFLLLLEIHQIIGSFLNHLHCYQ